MSPPRMPPGRTLPSPAAESGNRSRLTFRKLPRSAPVSGSSRSNPSFWVAGWSVGGPASSVRAEPVLTSIGNVAPGRPGGEAVATSGPLSAGIRLRAIGKESRVAEKSSPQPAVSADATARAPSGAIAAAARTSFFLVVLVELLVHALHERVE